MLLTYTDFLIESYTEVDLRSSKVKLLETIAKQHLNESEYLYYTTLLEHVNRDSIIECMDGNIGADALLESVDEKLFEESLLAKAKRKAQELKQKVKEKGQEFVQDMSDKSKNLLKIGGNILQPVKAVIAKLGELAAKAWDKMKSFTSSAVQKATEKIRGVVTGWMKSGEKKKSLKEEMGNLGAMGKSAGSVVKGWGGFMEKGAAKAAASEDGAKKESEESGLKTWSMLMESAAILATIEVLNEGCSTEQLLEEFALIEKYNLLEDDSMLHESGHDEGGLKIPFVSAILNKMHHMPPFSLFGKLGEAAGNVANNALERCSYYLSKLGGAGPFKFVLIGGLIGIVVSYMSESAAKGAIFSGHGSMILGIAIPGANILYNVIKYGGIAIAVHETVKAIMGQAEGEGHGDEKKEEGGEKKEDKKDDEKKEDKKDDEKKEDKKDDEKKEDKKDDEGKKKKPWWKF